MKPPPYGSDEWRALPADDPRRRASLVHAASCWRLLTLSPHIDDLLAEWVEWTHRSDLRETSTAISALSVGLAGAPSYAELDRRRAAPTTEPLTPEQIRSRAAASWAQFEAENAHRKGRAA